MDWMSGIIMQLLLISWRCWGKEERCLRVTLGRRLRKYLGLKGQDTCNPLPVTHKQIRQEVSHLNLSGKCMVVHCTVFQLF